MTNSTFTLLRRRAWIDRRIDELRRKRGASRLALLRLQALRLAVETRLRDLASRHRSLRGPSFA